MSSDVPRVSSTKTIKHVQIASNPKIFPPTYVKDFHDDEKVLQMYYAKLGNTGFQVSKLGLDASGFMDSFGSRGLENCKETVKLALQAGVNFIDTAPLSKKSEGIVGECLKNIPRQAYLITISVGHYGPIIWDFSAKATEDSIKESLKKLGLDQVDIIQIIDIENAPSLDYLIKETLPVVMNAVNEGKAKYIGISSYCLRVIESFIEKCSCKIDTITINSRLTLLDHSLLEYEETFKDFGVINGACLGLGLFTNRGPENWHPAPAETKMICEEARRYSIRKNVAFEKLAFHHVLKASKFWPHTHTIGMDSPETLQLFLDTIFIGLGEREYQAFTDLEKYILVKSRFQHWEEDTIE